MAPNTSRYWKKGASVKSVKSLNASVAKSLPKHTSAIARSFAAFTRFLLGYEESTKTYPTKPTNHELSLLHTATQDEILSDQRIFLNLTVDMTEKTWSPFKEFFMADLKTYGVSRMTFDWDARDTRGWNCIVAVLVGSIGVLRWLRGRAEDIRLNRLDSEKLCRKEQQRKKRVEAKQLLPDSDCCSDTEWDPEEIKYESLGVPWRSQQYSTLLHRIDDLLYHYKASVTGATAVSRRFDQCRTKSKLDNPKAPVCVGLPRNFEEELAALKMIPVSGLLNSLPAFIDSLLGN
ncbi:uncharacterized protein MELLADRAFT_101657 [Melampsora larici-populina 98AG31]|uniref:Uncharacterized protein n=1 Tax=Melampsora larici-populina (strain 98AG31 / pathotype 3-4-7) TaxID=747676 RepID=F4R6J6_MELLP|nr:uncharacterized protein MELLADRAFT_101657 [Melampsora larici-populina 98AG31]EGG11893.1 hypothetical protein MELLADRAFT_101657 [Melampsora larici-populina 98AG31]